MIYQSNHRPLCPGPQSAPVLIRTAPISSGNFETNKMNRVSTLHATGGDAVSRKVAVDTGDWRQWPLTDGNTLQDIENGNHPTDTLPLITKAAVICENLIAPVVHGEAHD